MIKEILVQVSSCEHAAALWTAITDMFSSQSRSRILQLRSHLSREKKGELSASAYYSKMKSIAEMAAIGKKIDDDELISFVLNRLDSEYNPFVSSVSVKDSLSLEIYMLSCYHMNLVFSNSDLMRAALILLPTMPLVDVDFLVVKVAVQTLGMASIIPCPTIALRHLLLPKI